MRQGVVSWYDPFKGYGLVIDTADMQRYYLPQSCVMKLGCDMIATNTAVRFLLADSLGQMIVGEIEVMIEAATSS